MTTTKTRKVGRPKNPNKRLEAILLRLTPDEKEQIETAAGRGSVVDWCRQRLLDASKPQPMPFGVAVTGWPHTHAVAEVSP